MTQRIAIYFSPREQTELSQFGEALLGRTPFRARAENAKSSFKKPEKWLNLTQKPAHYGFHATLKAPFELKKDKTLDKLLLDVEKFAGEQKLYVLKTLGPSALSNFMALTLKEQSEELAEFAFACVTNFECYRQSLSREDIARRKQQNLTTRQDELLSQFGYPYIADEFKFHMTLSGKLNTHDRDFHEWASTLYTSMVKEDPVLDQLCIFSQRDRTQAFVQIENFPLGISQSS